MKNLSSWLITIFVIFYWLFRVAVAITGSMGIDFIITPINTNIEIALLFVALICIPFIFKRKLLGAIVYLGAYGWYFGRGIIENVVKIINNETLSMQTYTEMFFALIGVALPILVLFDILLDRTRTKNPTDKKTDWFYKNDQYDRKLDERADKNNYRTL
ncbi:MAG: hypothetical protein HFJ41_04915 [Clostridia bacterium]|nr:hypothetical protein [Clostridia bacterium]